MQNHVYVRMGDGERVLMSSDQIKEDLQAGTQDAAQRAEIPQLTSDELEQLFHDWSFDSLLIRCASRAARPVASGGCVEGDWW